MAVHISLYAVDIPAFENFATRSLRSILEYYRERAVSPKPSLVFVSHESDSEDLYWAVPGEGIWYSNGKKKTLLSDQIAANNLFLSTRFDDYLPDGDSYDLLDVLLSFEGLQSIDWVRTISTGYRRWWVGSFLEYIQLALGHSNSTYLRVAALMQRALSGFDCGTILPPEENPQNLPFSFAPSKDNPDLRMSFWSSEESAFLCQTIRIMIADKQARFKKPSGFIGIDSEADDDWNDWVYKVLQEILVLEDPSFKNRLALSFIG
jgi:hypothetical protein